MNRYTFKIYDKKLKEFHIESLEDFSEDDYWYDDETTVWDVLFDCTNEQERFVAMQCTGLQDRDGNYIFENDIVSIKYEFEDKKLEAKAMVMWDSCGMFYFGPLDENWIDDWNFQDDIGRFKIIGNKFDKEVE
jgi:uncharacterized phage protein (TIGR01671 family)